MQGRYAFLIRSKFDLHYVYSSLFIEVIPHIKA